ncbi:MAG TPA: formate/nitrite transporter family protein [Anaeromyxobacter sp.]
MKATVTALASAARTKADLSARGPLRYLVLSALAGAYVGLGIVLIFAIGAPMAAAASPGTKALMGASFGVALTLVVFAGSELFTGNNLVMTLGALERKVSWGETLRVWLLSFAGNLAGSLALAAATVAAGVASASPMKEFVLKVSAAKMSAPASELFFRGLLCNVLVTLAVWMAAKTKDEVAKLLLIFWCLFAFIGAGFEHSIANMTLLGMAVLVPHDGALVSWVGFARNLVPVTLGNLVGGAVFVAGAYWFATREPAAAPAAAPAPAGALAEPSEG